MVYLKTPDMPIFNKNTDQTESVSDRTGTPTRANNESVYNMEFIYNPSMATRIVQEHLGIMIPSPERENAQRHLDGIATNQTQPWPWDSGVGEPRTRGDAQLSHLPPHQMP